MNRSRSSSSDLDSSDSPRMRELAFLWQLPPSFCWTHSTRDNYADHSSPPHSYGKYAILRQRLDFDYHGNYSKARQLMQDHLINDVVGNGYSEGRSTGRMWGGVAGEERPWIVFTAGAMGAGKSHTIHWLSDNGYFPLPDIVQVRTHSYPCIPLAKGMAVKLVPHFKLSYIFF